MKKKILFVVEAVTLAHLIRSLKLASSLSKEVYEIHFASTRIPKMLKNEIALYNVHLIKNGVTEKDFLDAISKGKHPYTEVILNAYVNEDRGLLESINPDVVIGDMRLSLAISSKLVGIPYINISNSTWDPSAVLPTLVPDIPVVRIVGAAIAKMVFPFIKNKIMNDLAKPFNDVAISHGLETLGSYYDILTSGDYTLYCDLKSLVTIKKPVSTKMELGALIYSINSENLPTLSLPDKKKPRVVLTLGSSGPTEQLQLLVNTLSELDIELIVATSGKDIVLPKNGSVILRDFLALDKILPDSDLLVFNGGSGSGYLGLSCGVPLLCIPSNIDQHQFSNAMAQKGVAQIIRSDKLSVGKLKRMVSAMVLDNQMRVQTEIMSEMIKNENPVAEFIDQIECIVAARVAPLFDIKKIVAAALQSPSGDNAQPWNFKWNGDVLWVLHNSARGAHSLNRSNHASLLALGGLLESIKLAANQMGMLSISKIYGEHIEQSAHWADVRFSQRKLKLDPLALGLSKRCTDRRVYLGGNINSAVIRELKNTNSSNEYTKIHTLGAPSKYLIRYFLDSETFLWLNKTIIKDLTKWMRLSKKETVNSPDGMSWKNLGINYVDALFLRVVRKYSGSLSVFWNLGMKFKIKHMTKANLKSSAGLICITVRNMDPVSICEAGKLAFRTWVTLNAIGYGVQPITYPSISIADMLSGDLPITTSESETNHFINGYGLLQKEFGLSQGEIPIWIFRTGISKAMPKSMRTDRLAVGQVLEVLPNLEKPYYDNDLSNLNNETK